MIKFKYHNSYIALLYETLHGEIVKFDEWGLQIDSAVCFNVCNDLIVNGTATLMNGEIVVINYEDVSLIDSFEYKTLGLPDRYPFDIFLDIAGAGLTDKNLKINYSFQDFAHGNGSGTELFFEKHRIGGYLKNELSFILSSSQYLLIKEIERVNNTQFKDSTDALMNVSRIQKLAVKAKVVLSKTLHDTLVVVPEKIKFEVSEIDNNKYKLSPIIKEANSDAFNNSFERFPLVKSNYWIRDNGHSVRVVLDDEQNDDAQSVKKQLVKLKNKSEFTGIELNEIYNNPTKFWDTDFVDLDDFSKRVLELGIYKPRFYPFISPYKSQWTPGIAIDDKADGTRHIMIENDEELEELRHLVVKSRTEGAVSIEFKNENVPLEHIDSIIDNAEKQLRDRTRPATTRAKENEKAESETKVLIIKENAESDEYSERGTIVEDVLYNFQEIDNLAGNIILKDHQRDGVAWLQTLSSDPHLLPGVLLADDMGLGKTLQVLYFIEWFSQNYKKKPVLIVAPVSLLENWKNEYEKFFPQASLNVITLWGSDARNYIIPSNREQTMQNLSKPAIYFTTYETLRRQQIPMGLIDWGILVLDEAQKVKTPGTLVTNAAKALKVDFKVAMTGTPVENSLMDLWCIIDFCSPGLLENAKEFSRKYQKPLEDEITDVKDLTEGLRNRIGATLMRRMKFDVAKDLPSIEYIKYKEDMPKIQYDTYLNELNSIKELKEKDPSSNPVLKGISNLRSISDHPYLKHYQVENIETDKLIDSSAKLKKVIQILSNIKGNDEKVIVFSENKSMQRLLRKVIRERFNLTPSIINGDTPTSKSKQDKTKLSRQQEIDKYQKLEGFNVIIMSPIAAGFGLNITEANHVIHYTRHWNPAKEQQATDRAYRIGQEKPVKVYYPMAVAPNDKFETFDIVLDKLLQRKSHLASASLFPTDQIEISRDDFIKSINLDSSEKKSLEFNNIEDLDKLKALDFEAAIAVLFEKKYGGDAWLTPVSNDKGADVIFFGDSVNYLIQVKRSVYRLDISSGQEITYALPEYQNKYDRKFLPMVVTNNYFTESAIDLARQNEVKLIDRDTLRMWISEYHINTNDIDRKMNDRTLQIK